eukprot:Skav219964  [mRNA]  locus=scaffold2879:306446:306799:- [translate_table: standard]
MLRPSWSLLVADDMATAPGSAGLRQAPGLAPPLRPSDLAQAFGENAPRPGLKLPAGQGVQTSPWLLPRTVPWGKPWAQPWSKYIEWFRLWKIVAKQWSIQKLINASRDPEILELFRD